MSCSMITMLQPVSTCTWRRSGPRCSVSRWATPAEGSSRRRTLGSAASMQPSSTIRRVPVERWPVAVRA